MPRAALGHEGGRLDPDRRPEVLKVQEWLDPRVAAGEVRIAVRAAGLNFADTMARVGFYPAAPKTPCVLGYEVAGEVPRAERLAGESAERGTVAPIRQSLPGHRGKTLVTLGR
jgi:NADPH:quinone reductase-like Zn-dependent oxidoreductase